MPHPETESWTTSRIRQGCRIGCFTLSRGGELIAADENAARIVGFASPAALLSAGQAPPVDEAQEFARSTGAEPCPTAFERAWVTPSGEQRCARVFLLPARGAGRVDHFEGVIEEVDLRTCRAPASSVGFVESLLDGLPNPVFVKDERHRWVLLNAAYCAFMGYEHAELIGKSDFDFFPPEEARVFWEKDDLVFANGGINENEERFTDASGRTHVIVTRKTLHVDTQDRRFLLGVITDITALREATEQLRASRDELEERVRQRTAELSAANALLREHDAQRAAFLNVLGHELRTPIAAIAIAGGVMERSPLGSAAVARARAVVGRQIRHLERLCDDLLDAARIARGKLEIRRHVIDLAAVVEDLCEDLLPMFQQRGVTLAVERSDERAWVDADETRLAQAIGNLLHNALKFTPAGGRVSVTVRRVRGTVDVVVRDTGIGIPPEEIDQMFEPFVQAPGARGRAYGGLGIGLPMAKGLVEAQGGTVTARSEGVDRGLEIAVSLPLAAEPPPHEPPEPSTREH